ncbi:hypothetical protein P0082_03950 [Candidatus Haliotispira prima]|uniref:Transposase IS200-like domain-containing protein n=1 Tax=Candidatus Haliotispira prima TaxID=3034016 RepID=A0ABY8MJ34_9SPIO|nr:hypothetical protein P0082_03950 [Candidatus Haliotispira prima]
MELYKGKYRIESNRLRSWNYGWNACYFVTICTQNRECFFGSINNGIMELSGIGHIANSCWREIPSHFPFVELGEHIIMPNHVHGIITINKSTNNVMDGGGMMNAVINVETQDFASPHSSLHSLPDSLPHSLPHSPPYHPPHDDTYRTPPSQNKFGPQSKNLGSIIRGFKIGVTKNARTITPEFSWQRNYHDHIIRDEKSYHNISNYIRLNPTRWVDDTCHPKNPEK